MNPPTPHGACVHVTFRLSEVSHTIGAGHRHKSAPVVREHQDRGLAARKDIDRLMTIMPAPTDTPSTCRNPHVDGCPECVVNAEEPWLRETAPKGCVATYRCTDCGHGWQTAWGCS